MPPSRSQLNGMLTCLHTGWFWNSCDDQGTFGDSYPTSCTGWWWGHCVLWFWFV